MKSFNELKALKAVFIFPSWSYNLFEMSMQCLNESSVVILANTKHLLEDSEITSAVTSPDLISQWSSAGKWWAGETTVTSYLTACSRKNVLQHPILLQLIPIKSQSSASLFRDSEIKKQVKLLTLNTFTLRGILLEKKHLNPPNAL